jgi:hypothetical protein
MFTDQTGKKKDHGFNLKCYELSESFLEVVFRYLPDAYILGELLIV